MQAVVLVWLMRLLLIRLQTQVWGAVGPAHQGVMLVLPVVQSLPLLAPLLVRWALAEGWLRLWLG